MTVYVSTVECDMLPLVTRHGNRSLFGGEDVLPLRNTDSPQRRCKRARIRALFSVFDDGIRWRHTEV